MDVKKIGESKKSFAEVVPTPFIVPSERKFSRNDDLRILVLKKDYQKRVIQGPKKKKKEPAEASDEKKTSKPKKLLRASVMPVDTKQVLLVHHKSHSASQSRSASMLLKEEPESPSPKLSISCPEDDDLVNHLSAVEKKYGIMNSPPTPPEVGSMEPLPMKGDEETDPLESISSDVDSTSSSTISYLHTGTSSIEEIISLNFPSPIEHDDKHAKGLETGIEDLRTSSHIRHHHRRTRSARRKSILSAPVNFLGRYFSCSCTRAPQHGSS